MRFKKLTALTSYVRCVELCCRVVQSTYNDIRYLHKTMQNLI